MNDLYDTVIIGGGAAGLSAAQMLGRARRHTLVIDGGQPRNRFAAHAHGILGHDGLAPSELYARGREELIRYDVELRTGAAESVTDAGEHLEVATDAGAIQARTIILATGITDRLPAIPGLAERWGTTVLHCPYCHGWEVRDQRLGVLVTSPMHGHLAQMVRQWSDQVTVFATDPAFLDADARLALAARAGTVVDGPVERVDGERERVTAVILEDGTSVPIDALFAGGTPEPHDSAVASLDLSRQDTPLGSLIEVSPDGATSHPRVWAAGNVVNPMAAVPVAMAEGSMAGARVNAALVGLDTDRAVRERGDWPQVAPASYWERRYAGEQRTWSGRVNPTMADAVAALTPGRSLDLGCGEGGDVVWMARQGWDAHGVDISTTAIERARAAASAAGASAQFAAADLSAWEPDGSYDLVTASFFHSPVSLDRAAILRRASAAVAPGGHLLVITHAAAPPWAKPEHVRDHTFLYARQEADALALDPAQWEEVRVELVEREATGPDGKPGHLTDGVVMLRRR